VVSNTIDGSLNTRWSAQGIGAFITFELDDSYEVNQIKIAFFKGDSRITFFSVESSTDGINYTQVLNNGGGSGNTKSLESFDVTATARFIRIVGGGNFSNDWNSLTEVEIWGKAVVPGQTVELLPVSDTYIRGGSFTGISYVSSKELWLKEANGETYKRRVLLKFPIANLSGQVTSAKVEFVPVVTGNTVNNVTLQLYETASWDNGVVWDDNPSIFSQLDTESGPYNIGQPITMDVTDHVKDKVSSSQNEVFFLVKSEGPDASQSYLRIASLENDNLNYRPRLVVSTSATVSRNDGNRNSLFLEEPDFFPNPSNGEVNIMGARSFSDLVIYDQNGRIKKSMKLMVNQVKIDVRDFETGLYLFRLTSGGEVFTHRILIK